MLVHILMLCSNTYFINVLINGLTFLIIFIVNNVLIYKYQHRYSPFFQYMAFLFILTSNEILKRNR